MSNKLQHFWYDAKFGELWFTYPRLYSWAVESFPSGSHFLEIGSWKGRSASYMGVALHNSGKDIKFDCVDTWDDISPMHNITGEELLRQFTENTAPVKHRINPVRAYSVDAASYYADNSIDFLFLDADHRYDKVIREMQAWIPKVKKGGVFAGHDYTSIPDVKQALGECFNSNEDFSDPWGEDCFFIHMN